MITKEQYNKALDIIEKYEDQIYEGIEASRLNIEEEIQVFMNDEKWYINEVILYKNQITVEISNNEYDEDFSMSKNFSRFLQTLDAKYGVIFKVDSGIYGK